MYWEHSSLLLLLWILPLLAWLLVYAHRRRSAAARRFASDVMVDRLMPALGGPRPWLNGGLLLAGVALLIVAAARPRFGVYTETVAQRGVDLFVLLDVSRSMLAEDVAPNRLERAKSDIRDLLPHLGGDRVGLIVFAGKPVVKAPLTNDEGFFRTVLDEVDVGSAPKGGTLIGDAIRKALEAMPRNRDRDQVLVLITDGDDQDSYAEDAAKQAAERGVKIFTVGLGDAREGARVPIRDASGRVTYVQYEGQEHWSKRNDQLLKQIALSTDGAYIPAGTQAYDLGQVYADHLAGLTRSEYQAEKRKRYHEQYQWFLAFGIFLLLVEMGIAGSPLPSSRLRDAGERGTCAAGRGVRAAGSGNKVLSTTTPILFLVLLLSTSKALAADPSSAVRSGITSYQAGNYKQAAEVFGEAAAAKPDDLRIAFDHGTALAAAEDDKAVELLQKAALSPELKLAVSARYNLGCLAAAKARKRFGAHPEQASAEVRKEGLADLVVAIGHFRDCLRLDKDHADARHNLELLRVWIKYMQSLWEQTDRQKQRDELDLPAYLQMLEEKQRGMRTVTQALRAAGPSPKLREAQRAAEMAQRKLGEEIGPLKQKIEATFSKAAQSSGGPGGTVSSDNLKKAVAAMTSMADEAGMAIDEAAGKLHSGKAAAAVRPQTDVVEKFDQMYRGVAPYPNLVGRAVSTQAGLVGEKGEDEKGREKEKKEEKSSNAQQPSLPAQLPNTPESAKEAAWDQDFVARYAELLPPVAKEGLKQLEASPAPPVVSGGTASKPGAAADDAEKQRQQREGLKKSMEKAIELAPKVEKLSAEAVELLRAKKPVEALPKQQEALKLLKEIAEPLPKQDQQQSKDQQKQDQKDQQDKDKQDQQKQDQKDQQKQDQKSQDKKQQKKRDEKRKEREQKKEEQREAAQQQAESQLQQVEQRQQKRQEAEKQLQRYLLRSGKVDKDW